MFLNVDFNKKIKEDTAVILLIYKFNKVDLKIKLKII